MKLSRHPAGAVWDDLSQDQRDNLRESLEDGFDPTRPVLVTNDDLVVDGWHRLSICNDLGIEPVTMIVADDEVLQTIARRHCDLSTTRMLSPGARASGIVKAMQACGREFAKLGQRGPAGGGKNEAITIDEVADLARCGRNAARTAIDNAKGIDRQKNGPRPQGVAPDQPPSSQMIALPWPGQAAWPNFLIARKEGSSTTLREAQSARNKQRDMAHSLAKDKGIKIPAVAFLTVTFHPPRGTNFDVDNGLAAIKGDLDGLAKASGVDDAGWQFVILKGEFVEGGAVVIEWRETKDPPKRTESALDSAPWQGAQDATQDDNASDAPSTDDLDHVAVLERARNTAEAERDEANERLALIETQLNGDEQDAVDKVTQMASEIETLKSQLASWQEKYTSIKRERDALVRKLKSMGG